MPLSADSEDRRGRQLPLGRMVFLLLVLTGLSITPSAHLALLPAVLLVVMASATASRLSSLRLSEGRKRLAGGVAGIVAVLGVIWFRW